VLSAVAVRFAFPAVSLEGKAFWILQSAPISLRSFLWSKFWMIFVPLLFLGALLVFLSNLLLHVPQWMMALSLTTVGLMTFGIVAIGVGLGALYPKFDYENAAEIPTSFGGAVAMILSVGFIAAAVMIEAWPVYQLTMASLRHGRIATPTFGLIAPPLLMVAVLTLIVVTLSLRIGIKRLEELRG
jgi:ABC-2 type transport system permease protein